MWRYQQSTGELTEPSGSALAKGWAGHGEGLNNPAMQSDPDIGPLPAGNYTIGEPHDSPHTGPFTMDLMPAPENQMFGRSEFRIHGAAEEHPELSSDGCIILPRPVRENIWQSGDREIEVIA